MCDSTLVSHLFWFSATPFWPLIKPLMGSKKLTILSKCSENIFFPSHWYSLRRQTDHDLFFSFSLHPSFLCLVALENAHVMNCYNNITGYATITQGLDYGPFHLVMCIHQGRMNSASLQLYSVNFDVR